MTTTTPLEQILNLTRTLGQPQNEYVIVGEGNTSYRIDADTFLIKASGQGMSSIDASGFVAVRFEPILALFEQQTADRAALQQAMIDAKVDASTPGRPSVEVTFHAMLLHGCNVKVIAHTHPVAVNSLLCSTRANLPTIAYSPMKQCCAAALGVRALRRSRLTAGRRYP
ncbi:MAG: class II aldolase/adducin family protein [Chloroflexi bacterium]|nr:class II aldolase/adducin family protein [Chloroflexota bacterium]